MADLNTDKARQGRSGRPVLYVLIAALALCLVVFAGLGIYGSVLPDENINGVENSGTTGAPATPDNSSATTTVSPAQSNQSGAAPAN